MKLGDWFETRKRENGEAFVMIRADAPEWMLPAIKEAHADMLPCDWVYAQCHEACVAIDEGSLGDEDGVHAWVDGNVEIYTQELFAWASRMCLTSLWANAEEEANEICGETASMNDRLMAIQYCAIRAIANIMIQAANDAREEEVAS